MIDPVAEFYGMDPRDIVTDSDIEIDSVTPARMAKLRVIADRYALRDVKLCLPEEE